MKIKITKTIGLPLKDMEVTPGRTVNEVLKQSRHFDTPGELIKCHVYQENKNHELTILDKNTDLNSDTDLLVVSPILGAAPVAPPGMSFREFWKATAADFWENIRFGWPVFLVLAAFLFSSAYLISLLEHARLGNYWNALYFTWITMTTIGYGDLTPQSFEGRLLASIDGLIGIVLFGVVVWLITHSLTHDVK